MPLKNPSILLVEDEPMTREGLRKTLESWSAGRYLIHAFDNANDALGFTEKHAFDLLITDIRMPEISGLELVSRLAKKLNNDMPPVIILSGYAEFDYAMQAIRLGVVSYLLKPVSNAKLIEEVKKALLVNERRSRIGIMEKMFDSKLLDAGSNESDASDSIKAALEYIDRHLSEPFGMQDVADYVHLNASYFSVLFKDQMGITFSDYLTRRRLQRAKELLIQTRLPIAEIALNVGYHTAKYFNRIFKEYEGFSPGQYREKIKQDNGL
ncbi:MAG TPA: response regulator [Bacilli bacterium]